MNMFARFLGFSTFCRDEKFEVVSVSLFLFLTFFLFAAQAVGFMVVWTCFGVLFFCQYVRLDPVARNNVGERIAITYFLFVVMSCLFVLPFSGARGLSSVYYALNVALVFGIAHFISKRALVFYSGFTVALYLIQFVLLSIILLSPYLDPLGSIVEGSSSNGITSYLILVQACYNGITYVLKRNVPPWGMNVITFYICFVGQGRGSIAAGFLLLGINILYVLVSGGSRKRFGYAVVIIVALLFAVLKFDLLFSFAMKTNLARGFYDQPRIEMWIDYFRSLSFVESVVGGDLNGTIIGDFYLGNPHNSFLRAHNKFGVLYMLLMVVSPFGLFLKGNFGKEQIFMFLTLAVVFFRAMTEPILFPTFLDLFYFSSIYCAVRASYLGTESVVDGRGAWSRRDILD
ncbi:hypothetical protein AB1A81_07700 [Bdellovibrio bacteriovorus]|nr:hypothetical protein [Bdellovibrio bacteriovorus]